MGGASVQTERNQAVKSPPGGSGSSVECREEAARPGGVPHLFSLVPSRKLSRWLVVSLPLTLLLGGYITYLNTRLATVSAPLGVVSLQFARTEVQAREILRDWEPQQPHFPTFSTDPAQAMQPWTNDLGGVADKATMWEFALLATYLASLALLCFWTGRGFAEGSLLARTAGLFAWFVWTAGLLDALTSSMTMMLFVAGTGGGLPWALRYAALGKFLLLFAVLVYCAWGARKRRAWMISALLWASCAAVLYPVVRCFRG